MFVICADAHFGGGKNLGPDRQKDLLNSFKQVVDYAVEKRVKYFVILGDSFDYSNPSNGLRSQFTKQIKCLLRKRIQVIILVGNHEFAAGTHALSQIKALKILGLQIVDDVKAEFRNGIGWVFFPHNSNVDAKGCSWSDLIKIYAQKREMVERRIVLGHFPVSGSSMGSSNYQFNNNDSAQISQLKKLNAKFIFLGDIHKPQELFENCYYVGSIDRQNFGEANEQKRFIHVTKGWKVKSVPIKNRRLLKLVIDSKTDYSKVKNAIVKPVIECSISEVNMFDTKLILSRLEDKGAHFITEIEWNIKSKTKKKPIRISSDINILKYMKSALKRNYPDVDLKKILRLYETFKS